MATRLAILLAERGHEVHILTYARPRSLPKDTPDGLHFHETQPQSYPLFRDIGTSYSLIESSAIIRLVKEENVRLDLINSHYAIPHALGADIAAQSLGIPSVATLHGSDVHTLGRHSAFRHSLSAVLNRQDSVTAVSNYLSEEAVRVFELVKRPTTIHNFIDYEVFKPFESEDGGKKEENGESMFVITHASNFRPIKNVPLLVKAFVKFAKDKDDVCLQLIGDGPEKSVAQSIVDHHDAQAKVQMLGVRDDIPRLFAKADVLVAPSRNESFGLTIGESLACETAVIGARVGGIPEVIRDGKDGLLFESGNQDELGSALQYMYGNPIACVEMGRNGRKRMMDVFDPESIVSQYESLFYSLTSN